MNNSVSPLAWKLDCLHNILRSQINDNIITGLVVHIWGSLPFINVIYANFPIPERPIEKVKNVKQKILHLVFGDQPLAIVSNGKAFEWEKVAMMQASQELHLSIEIVAIPLIRIFHLFHQANATTTLSEIRSICRYFGIAINDSVETIGCLSYILVWNSPHKECRTWTNSIINTFTSSFSHQKLKNRI